MRTHLYLRLVWIVALVFSGEVGADDYARVLLYHNVSDSTPALTSVTPEKFEQHLNYLELEGFSVLPLTELLHAIGSGISLPDRSIAISFDDAYLSVYEQAFPLLKSRGWPFSVFVSSDAVDFGYGSVMTWSELAELQDYGAEIGGHSASHMHLLRHLDNETEDEWRNRMAGDIDRGNNRIEEQLGISPRLFAYPYGEHSEETRDLVNKRGLYGLAQQSGAIGQLTDFAQIPRYPMAQSFAGMERFALVVNSRPLPVTEIDGGSLIRMVGEPSGEISFSLLLGDYQITQIACFSSDGQQLRIKRTGAQVRVALPDFVAGRNKINCTAPAMPRLGSNSESGVFYWFSEQWIVKHANGDWVAE